PALTSTTGLVTGTTVTDWNGASTTINDAVSLATLQRNPGENAGNYAITNGTLTLTGTLTEPHKPAKVANRPPIVSTTTHQITLNPFAFTTALDTVIVTLTLHDALPILPALTSTTGLVTGTTVTDWNGASTTINDAVSLATLQRNPGENAGNYAITNGTL